MIRMVIFDYGRTLYDREMDQLFPDAVGVVKRLAGQYRLSIVSFSSKEDEVERIAVLKKHGLLEYFDDIQFTDNIDEKFQKYDEVLQRFALTAGEVAVVDDHVIRGVSWGNQVGATTIWFQNGKFANVMPDERTGQPNFVIHSLSELIGVLT